MSELATIKKEAQEENGSDLLYIQANISVPKARKNEFGGFNYRNCEDIVNALKPLLDERGCILTITDEVILLGEGEHARFYIKATAKFTASGGSFREAHGFAREPLERKGMDASQISGSASSYARKYALSGLFLLDDSVDPDEVLNITEAEAAQFMDMVDNGNGIGLYSMQITNFPKYASLRLSCAPKGGKTKFIQKVNQLVLDVVDHSKEVATEILDLLEKEDKFGIQEIVEDLSREEKIITWRQIPDDRHDEITALMKS